MNLFVLNEDPDLAARWACDQHVCKMPTETAQMLGFIAHRTPSQDWSDFPRRHPDGTPYPYSGSGSHKTHPCTLWVGATRGNWDWAVAHGLALCAEYARRYTKPGKPPKVHKAQAIIEWFRDRTIPPLDGPLQPFVQCMPDEFKRPDPVDGYRAFYLGDKVRFARWLHSDPPPWWVPVKEAA
jgi:hypothetical protein